MQDVDWIIDCVDCVGVGVTRLPSVITDVGESAITSLSIIMTPGARIARYAICQIHISDTSQTFTQTLIN